MIGVALTGALLALTLGFALQDAVGRYRRLRRVGQGGFSAELQEIAATRDVAVAQALRNELTVSVEAELAQATGYSAGHTRICFGAGVVAVVIHVRSEPFWALGFGVLAALTLAVTLILGRMASEAGRKARAHWKRVLGAARTSR